MANPESVSVETAKEAVKKLHNGAYLCDNGAGRFWIQILEEVPYPHMKHLSLGFYNADEAWFDAYSRIATPPAVEGKTAPHPSVPVKDAGLYVPKAQYEAMKDQLETKLAALQSSLGGDGWVKVEDRLPEINEYVWVFTGNSSAPQITLSKCAFLSGITRYWSNLYTSHWQPMNRPTAPPIPVEQPKGAV
jgi:hypothetical protein